MNTIKFNNTTTFEVFSYNRNTTFEGDAITGNGFCSIAVQDASDLVTLAANPITQIQIYHNNELIYNLEDINAVIQSISESLEGDKMNISFYLIFDNLE